MRHRSTVRAYVHLESRKDAVSVDDAGGMHGTSNIL